jgi:hypothetical protein
MMRTSITDFRTELPIKTEIVTRMRVFDTVVYDEVLVYPISTESDVVVEIRNEEILEALDIQFYNLLGQTMTEPKQLLTNETRFDTQTWADGFYLAVLKRISDGKVIRKQKIFVD